MEKHVVSKKDLWELMGQIPTERGGDLMSALAELGRSETDQTIKKAFEEGLMRFSPIRTPIKLPPSAPKIGVALPMGAKDDLTVYVNPDTDKRFVPKHVIDPETGDQVVAHPGARANGMVPIEWLMNAFQIVSPLLCTMFFMVRKGILSAPARDQMTHEMVKHGMKYIFYWDDDTIIPPKAIYEMHNMMERNPDLAVLSGVYVTREECPEPLVFQEQGQGSYWNFTIEPGVTEPIFGAGAGCMMARVEAIEDFARIHEEPWWMDYQDLDGLDAGKGKNTWGHDIRFCRNMWAMWQKDEDDARSPGPTGEAKTFRMPQDEDGNDIDWFTGYQVRPDGHQVVPGRDDVLWDPNAKCLVLNDETLTPSDEDFEPYQRVLTKADPPRRNWEVHVAGWIQCIHYDYQKQKGFQLPPDAPCFKDKNTKTYWDLVWGREGHETWRHYSELYDRILEIVPRNSYVVDVGCGIGILMERLLKSNHCHVYGIDISERAIELLKQRDLNGESGDIVDVDFETTTPDEIFSPFIDDDNLSPHIVMVSTETIEHLVDEKLDHLFSEASKHFDQAVFSTPSGDLEGTPDGEHVQVWTADSLEIRLRQHFKSVEVTELKTEGRPDNPYLVANCSK